MWSSVCRYYVQLPTQKAHDFHGDAPAIQVVHRVPDELENDTITRLDQRVAQRLRDIVSSGETRVYAVRKQLRYYIAVNYQCLFTASSPLIMCYYNQGWTNFKKVSIPRAIWFEYCTSPAPYHTSPTCEMIIIIKMCDFSLPSGLWICPALYNYTKIIQNDPNEMDRQKYPKYYICSKWSFCVYQ